MTVEEIMRMAQEARISLRGHYDETGSTLQELERFANLVLKAERQACAELVQVHMTAASIDMGVAICVRGRK